MHWAESIPDGVVAITQCDGVSFEGVFGEVIVESSGSVRERDERVAGAGVLWSSSSVLAEPEEGGGAAAWVAGTGVDVAAALKGGGSV